VKKESKPDVSEMDLISEVSGQEEIFQE